MFPLAALARDDPPFTRHERFRALREDAPAAASASRVRLARQRGARRRAASWSLRVRGLVAVRRLTYYTLR